MRCGFILFLLSTGFLALSCSDSAAAERLYARASDAYIREDFSNALSLADEAVRADGDFFQARLLKAKLLIFTEKTGDAEKILRALCKRYPDFTEARLWYARALIMMERYDKAETLLERELALNQTDWRFYYQYALLAQKQNAADKRLSLCRKAEQALCDSEKVYIETADIWLTLGVRSNALDALDKAYAVSAHPDAVAEIIHFVKRGDDIR